MVCAPDRTSIDSRGYHLVDIPPASYATRHPTFRNLNKCFINTIGRKITFCYEIKLFTNHRITYLIPSKMDKSFGQTCRGNNLFDPLSSLAEWTTSNDKRNMNRSLVTGALVIIITTHMGIMVTSPEMGTMIARIDDDGFVINIQFFQFPDQSAKIPVATMDCSQVIRILRFPISLWKCSQIGRNLEILEPVFAPFRTLIMASIILVVRFYLADSKKERTFTIISFEELKSLFSNKVSTVFLETDAVFILVENVSPITIRSKFQNITRTPETGIPTSQDTRNRFSLVVYIRFGFKISLACQMPFAHIASLIPGTLHVIGKRLYRQWQHLAIAKATKLGGTLAGLENRTGGTTDRLWGNCRLKNRSFLGQSVQTRSDIQSLAIATTGIGSLLVCEIK